METCKSCKGTRRITLSYSVVECLDCQPVALCTAELKVGDRVVTGWGKGQIVEVASSHEIVAVRLDTGGGLWAHLRGVKKEDTI